MVKCRAAYRAQDGGQAVHARPHLEPRPKNGAAQEWRGASRAPGLRACPNQPGLAARSALGGPIGASGPAGSKFNFVVAGRPALKTRMCIGGIAAAARCGNADIGAWRRMTRPAPAGCGMRARARRQKRQDVPEAAGERRDFWQNSAVGRPELRAAHSAAGRVTPRGGPRLLARPRRACAARSRNTGAPFRIDWGCAGKILFSGDALGRILAPRHSLNISAPNLDGGILCRIRVSTPHKPFGECVDGGGCKALLPDKISPAINYGKDGLRANGCKRSPAGARADGKTEPFYRPP